MGREVKRVPLDFDWPINKIWPGYMFNLCSNVETYFENEPDHCELCRQYAKIMNYEIASYGCPELPFRDPPHGEGWQLWETVSEGTAMSPVFKTPEELAHWLTDTGASASGYMTAEYDTWLKFITEHGYAPSMMVLPGKGIISGVEAMTVTKEVKVDAAEIN